jgi:hypothetical protein
MTCGNGCARTPTTPILVAMWWCLLMICHLAFVKCRGMLILTKSWNHCLSYLVASSWYVLFMYFYAKTTSVDLLFCKGFELGPSTLCVARRESAPRRIEKKVVEL